MDKRNRRKRKHSSARTVRTCVQVCGLVTILGCCFGLYKAFCILDDQLRQDHKNIHRIGRPYSFRNRKPRIPPPTNGHRFLVFAGSSDGQGAGNVMQGLLAAQLLGEEFNRTVCVVWPEFFQAFDYAQPQQYSQLCDRADEWEQGYNFVIWNFVSGRVDECKVKQILSDPEKIVVGYSGNTYPGWRSKIPPDFFHHYYRPKSALLHSLPYPPEQPPQVVVHLREPDGESDKQRGLDRESLNHLGQLLVGNGTYLVTNRPDWYHRFHFCCGWSYDKKWVDKPIDHGAVFLSWHPDGTKVRTNNLTTSTDQTLKLWADWYTLLRAQHVYHSPSDFSRSAVHWNSQSLGHELHGMKQATTTEQKTKPNGLKNSTTTTGIVSGRPPRRPGRELNLLPTYPSKFIPALVDRQEPDALRNDDACIFLRYCRQFGVNDETNPKRGPPRTRLDQQISALLRQQKPAAAHGG